VMELCVDNPREGFADLFSTHPSVESRVKALVETAGGHDPGPLALPPAGRTGSGRRVAGPGAGRPGASGTMGSCRSAGRARRPLGSTATAAASAAGTAVPAGEAADRSRRALGQAGQLSSQRRQFRAFALTCTTLLAACGSLAGRKSVVNITGLEIT
jgi:hypothetical protein